MNETIGKRISYLRKEKGITQEEMAEKLGVTPQAVSKWENDISYPDITLLPKIAELLGVTVDELLSGENKKEIRVVPEEQRKNLDDLVFKIKITSSEGDKVRVNIPLPLIKLGIKTGLTMPQISGNVALQNIDFEQLIHLVESGVIGKLIEIESADGDIVEIVVE